MKLSELIREMDYVCVQGTADTEISSLVCDSRDTKENSVFVCITGFHSDGHSFVPQAAQRHAAAIVVEKEVDVPAELTVIRTPDTRIALAKMSAAYFGYPARRLTTIGITGTKGKTTTACMIRTILEDAGYGTGLIGTLGTFIKDQVIKTPNTTPESLVIQKSLRDMADAGCRYAVMEVSSQGLMLHHTDGILFDYGVFTNLGPDHIGPGEHKNLEHYIACKSRLFRQCRHGIVNGDDRHLGEVLKDCRCDLETFGFSEERDVYAKEIRLFEKADVLGISCRIRGDCETKLSLPMPGEFNLYNAMAALCVCTRLGIGAGRIQESLRRICIKGRTEIIQVPGRGKVLIDYAHNAMSLRCLLQSLRRYHPQRLICLFGCGGNRSGNRRFEMGEVSASLADLTVITSDNPRYEDPVKIMDDIIAGAKKGGGAYVAVGDRAEAIRYCLEHAREGDFLVLAGKGHEDYQEIMGKRIPMDDRRLLMEELLI